MSVVAPIGGYWDQTLNSELSFSNTFFNCSLMAKSLVLADEQLSPATLRIFSFLYNPIILFSYATLG